LKKTLLKVLALDFDGTLVESNNIKDCAFETIFSEWPEHTESMMQWHLANDAIERREKFRYFVEEVLALSEQNDLIEKLTARFGQLTKSAIVECPFVKGVEDFLEYIWNRFPVYLVSATPQIDLVQIIEERKLCKYFKEIYGAPIRKIETLKKIMLSEKASADEILFIGDSPEDQQSGELLGIEFIGRQSDRQLSESKNYIFSDFVKIKKHIYQYYDL
jgi:phosphoglycolate phosphatase-like HAD superfamily hydrolase